MLTELPLLVVDRFLRFYVSDHDLRLIQQVSPGWRDLVTARPAVNARRLAIVAHIRQERENIRDPTQEAEVEFPKTVSSKIKRVKEDDTEKPGSRLPLSATTNMISSKSLTPSSLPQLALAKGNAPRQTNSSTPKSHFQRRIEAVGKLMKGQVLFSCPDCKSPVPSPVISRVKKEKSIVKIVDKELTSTGSELSDSGISLTSPVSSNQSAESRADIAAKSPEYINISLLATPPSTPNMNEGDSTQSDPEISYDDIISSISLNESLIGYTQPKESSIAEKPSVEYLRDGSLFRHYSYLFNSPIATPNQSSSWTSLPVNESHGQSTTKSSLMDPRACFTKILPKLDFDEGSGTEERPYVVECQDCSYRFCSRCEFKEHPGEPCRLIGGMDDLEDSGSILLFKSTPNSSWPSSKSSGSNKSGIRSPIARKAKGGSPGKQAKKSSLRRLAKLK